MKPRVNQCKSCGAVSSNLLRIKSGRCYACRKRMHGDNIPNEVPFRLRVVLGIIVVLFMVISARSIYFQHVVLPYSGGRSRSMLLEFTGIGIVVPILALVMYSIGLLALIVDHYDRRPNERAYEKIIKYSLCAGVILYWISIFFWSSSLMVIDVHKMRPEPTP